LRTCFDLASAVLAIGVWSGRMGWFLHGGAWVTFIVLAYTGVFGFWHVLWAATKFCQSMVQQVIEDTRAPINVDWDQLLVRVFQVQTEISALWQFQQAGAPVFSCVGSGISCLAFCVISQITDACGKQALAVLFFVGCVLVAGPLAMLSSISSMCRDKALDAHSIPGEASRRVEKFSAMPKDEKVAYDRFLRLMRSQANPMGVSFCGLLITAELVISTFLRVAVGMPAAYGVLNRMMHNHNNQN